MEELTRMVAACVMVVVVVVAAAGTMEMVEAGGQASDGCDAVVAEVKDLCRDYVVGNEPPSPGLFSPCCKSLRRNRAALRCLCGRVDFSALNKRNLFFTSTICLIGPLECA